MVKIFRLQELEHHSRDHTASELQCGSSNLSEFPQKLKVETVEKARKKKKNPTGELERPLL